jgi:hypothetical protein
LLAQCEAKKEMKGGRQEGERIGKERRRGKRGRKGGEKDFFGRHGGMRRDIANSYVAGETLGGPRTKSIFRGVAR